MQIKLLLTPLLALWAASAAAATRTWDGGDASGNWSATANWNPNATIAAGDTLVFPAGLLVADRTTNNNYAAGTAWSGITFQDGGYTLSGNQVRLTNSLVAGAPGTVTVNADIILGGSASMVADEGATLDLAPSCTVNLNGFPTAFGALKLATTVLVRGPVTGTFAGNINFTGPGIIDVRGAKTFTANPLILNFAELRVDNSGSLGNAANEINLLQGELVSNPLPGEVVQLPQTLRMKNALGDSGVLECRTGNLMMNGPLIATNDGSKLFEVAAASGLWLNGLVTATGGRLIKSGAGTLYLAPGLSPNAITNSGFSIAKGTVIAGHTSGIRTLGGEHLWIGNSDTTAQDCELRLNAGEQIPPGTPVHIQSDGLFNLNGHTETVADLDLESPARVGTGAGELILTDSIVVVTEGGSDQPVTYEGNLRVGTANQRWLLGNLDYSPGNIPDVHFTGSISGSLPDSTFVKDGSGQLWLHGDHTISSIRSIFGMTFMQGNSPGTDIEAGGDFFIYSGSARHLNVTSGRLVVEGLWPSKVHNTIDCADLTLNTGAELSLTIGSQVPVPGTTHDQLRVSGSVNLTGGKLVMFGGLNGGTPMSIGDEVILVSKSGVSPVSGIFDGLPEGSIIEHLGMSLYLSYHGGDGNDISLTSIVPPTGVTRIWDGGSANNSLWSTAANWVGDTAPQPGDALRFPAVAARKNNVNDYPAGTTFQSVSVLGSGQGTGYSISGNGIVLNESLDFGSAAVDHMWSVPLSQGLPVLINAGGAALIQIAAAIDNQGHVLTLQRTAGTGDIYFSGGISGSGRVEKRGPGRITYFDQPNTYTGQTDVIEGVLALTHLATPGSGGATVIVRNGAVLELRNNEDPITCSKPISLAGTLRDSGGAFPAQFTGVVAVNHDPDPPVVEANGTQLALNGSITGPPSWRKRGAGLLTIGGNLSNANSGSVYVDAGELRLQKNGAPALGGGVILASAGNPATLSLGASDQIPDAMNVQINHPGAVFNVGTFQERINTLYLYESGTVTGAPAGRLTLKTLNAISPTGTAVITAPLSSPPGETGNLVVTNGSGTPDLRIEAAVYGTGFEKSGDGRVDFMTSIPQGGLAYLNILNGSALVFANCRYTDVSLNGGLLGGQGVVGNIFAESGGTISPGASAGSLGGYKAVWNAATAMRMEIYGTSPGTEYDQYAAFAPIDLGSAKLTLTVDNNYNPPANTEFMIIRNVSGEAVTGTFAGLAEGAYLSAPGARVFRISYHGGDGDDVVLTSVEVDPPVIVQHGMGPGTGEHKGENDTHLLVEGTPGLTYLLEQSTDLTTWVPGEYLAADLVTGLMDFHHYSPEAQPRLFLRVRLP